MAKHEYRGKWYTTQELADMAGMSGHAFRDRLRRGYTVEQALQPAPLHNSIKEFTDASYWKDWIGLSITDLYKIYWKWCVSNEYTPLQKQGFSRQLFTIYPNLKCVPTKYAGISIRIIRERS